MLHTTDGGASWRQLTLPDIRFRGRVVVAVDPQTCWAFDGTFYSYRTRDGGLTWEALDFDKTQTVLFNDADFISSDVGSTASWTKSVFRTRTGGEPDVPAILLGQRACPTQPMRHGAARRTRSP